MLKTLLIINISGFMKKASYKTIETINRNSKNGFFSKYLFIIFNS